MKNLLTLALAFLLVLLGTQPAEAKKSKNAFRWMPELEREFFKADTVRLFGCIEDYDPNVDFKTLQFNLTNAINGEAAPRNIIIKADGTFSLVYVDAHPRLAELTMQVDYGYKVLRFYTVPGETTEISITKKGKVSYVSCPGGLFACDKALHHDYAEAIGDKFIQYYDYVEQKRLLADVVRDARSRLKAALLLADWMAWRFGYTPWEHHLARTYARSCFGAAIFEYCMAMGTSLSSPYVANSSRGKIIGKILAAPKSYTFMRDMSCDEPATLVFSQTSFTLSRYELSPMLVMAKEKKTSTSPNTALMADNLMAAIDRQILKAEQPSFYLQLLLLRDFSGDLKWNYWMTPEAWQTVYDAKREKITHPGLREQLDRIYARYRKARF